MNLARTLAVAKLEFRQTLRRPMFWVMLILLGLMTWGLSAGNVTISSGDSSVGGKKSWINSESQLSFFLIALSFLIVSFFAAVAGGMAVLRDDEVGASEILHSTPLRPGEYVWGKFGGVATAFLLASMAHAALLILFFQVLPLENADEIRGPFRLGAYLRPMVVFALPNVLFFLATAFALGERTRRAIVVFFLPVAFLLFGAFFLWSWSPSWLDPRLNDVMMILEPGGFRWLNEVWLQVDLGVEVYNTQPVDYDWRLYLNRAWILLVSLLAVASSVPHVRRATSGDLAPGSIGRWLQRRRQARAARKGAALSGEQAAPGQRAAIESPRLSELKMSNCAPSVFSALRAIVRAEVRELRNQPGLYLFVPLILIQTISNATFAVGAFDTPLLLTSGLLAVNAMNIITTLVCFLLLFYTVESLQRERSTGFGELLYSSPVRTGVILFGKALANSLVGALILFAAFLGSVLVLLVQGTVPLQLWPFVATWLLLVVPTFILWTAYVTFLYALVRERYTAYALALATLFATAYYLFRGDLTWVWNWPLWGVVSWSDMGTFELLRQQLFFNRLTALGAAGLFTALAVRLFGRRDFDGLRSLQRLRPKPLLGAALRLSPIALIPIVTAGMLAYQVRAGHQSEAAEKLAKDYWRKNLATYFDADDAPTPVVDHLDLEVTLDPPRRAFATTGTYRLRNEEDRALGQFAMTANRSWDELVWTLDGNAAESEDREGLHVLSPPQPLLPGESIEVGFSLRGQHPKGATKNGGGASTFVLPAGIVLHAFEPSFLPLPGYLGNIGIDEDNQFEPKEYPDDFWERELDTAFGKVRPFTARVEITTPAEYTANSVGTKVAEKTHQGERGEELKTVVWETEHPIKLINIVAARYEVHREGGTALFYHPEHHYNVEEMSHALQAAREHFSEWFYEYPWNELKVSEFPNLAGYAQGFPTNITFSEGIGFLTKSERGSRAAFMVTAHEAAHQWWGNLITPGEGPGGNILSEGMAHYATLLLHEEEYGIQGRIEFATLIEDRYAENRQLDSERPLVKTDGSRAGDTTVTYDKGGWAMWMLHHLIGREAALSGLQELFRVYVPSTRDHPVLQDLLATLRPFAPDQEAFDAYVAQWYFDVVVPEYRFSEVRRARQGGAWRSEFTLTNVGTGEMQIEVAAESGERFPEPDSEEGAQARSPTGEANDYLAARVSTTLAAGESAVLEVLTEFEPQRLVVDPDALVLQLNRQRAVHRF